MKRYPIYYLNLQRQTERREKFESEWGYIGQEYTRIEQVDRRDVDKGIYPELRDLPNLNNQDQALNQGFIKTIDTYLVEHTTGEGFIFLEDDASPLIEDIDILHNRISDSLQEDDRIKILLLFKPQSEMECATKQHNHTLLKKQPFGGWGVFVRKSYILTLKEHVQKQQRYLDRHWDLQQPDLGLAILNEPCTYHPDAYNKECTSYRTQMRNTRTCIY